MSGNWFFLSYARLDRENDPNNYISRFYEDVDKEIRRIKLVKEGTAGFLDGTGIQQGDKWPDALVDSLSNCRVLICMYSTAYFDSDYCGREWQVFNSRVEPYAASLPAGSQRPLLILPVMFSPPQEWDDAMPSVLQDIQYKDDEYPAEYRENGLLYLMRRTSKKEAYQNFLDALVKKLMSATKANELPPLQARPDIKLVKSAFHQCQGVAMPDGQSPGADSNLSDNFGPRYAEFVYVAARRNEIRQIKPIPPSENYYGDEGELDWKPYWPSVETEVGMFAQSIATKEGFRYSKISLEDDLVEQIRGAQANRRIVVVIVDTWTLCLQKYLELMNSYDDASFWNSVVLVAWNDNDPEAAKSRRALEAALQRAFPTKIIIRDNRYFIDNIRTSSDLENNLSVALQTVKMQIINAVERFNRIESAQNFGKPEIPAPGGTSN